MSYGDLKFENYKNKICPYCQSRLKRGADITVCSECGTPHHKECWDENSGCTSYGCQNNPLSERIQRPEPEDVGSLTIESIRQTITKPAQEELMLCTSCKQLIEIESVFCKFCGHNLKEEEIPVEKIQAADDFNKEFRKRYSDKITFTRRRRAFTYGSIFLLILAIGLLVFISVNRINEYFASDKFKIQMLIENYEEAVNNRNVDSLNIYFAEDYEFITKSGKKSEKRERIKSLENIFKKSKIIEYNITDLRIVNDTTVTANDKKIKFRDEFITDKKTDKEEKTLRVYNGESTDYKWKIYREETE